MSIYDKPEKHEKLRDDVINTIDDKKISFAKVILYGGFGPYYFVFNNSIEANHVENSALDFKKIKDTDIHKYDFRIFEFGVKKPEEINKLPIFNVKKYSEKIAKEKAEKKEAKKK